MHSFALTRPYAGACRDCRLPVPRRCSRHSWPCTRTKELLEEAARFKLGITPVGADEVQPLLDKISKSPPELMEYMRKLAADSKG